MNWQAAEAGRPLVICYGNRLRGDDGVAWHVADRLGGDRRLRAADVQCVHQLTPELAVDVSRASHVVLVDARVGERPGAVSRVAVTVPAGRSVEPRWSHGFTPVTLATLTAALFGHVPPIDVVTVAAASLEIGEELSAPVAAAVGPAADAVAAIVAGTGRREAGRRPH